MSKAQTYFQNQFPELTKQVNVPDTTLVRQLWQEMQGYGEAGIDNRCLAETCLRCYISHQIAQACRDLGARFGSRNGFTYEDLLPFVLDDEGRYSANSVPYRSLASTVYQSPKMCFSLFVHYAPCL